MRSRYGSCWQVLHTRIHIRIPMCDGLAFAASIYQALCSIEIREMKL